MGQEETDGAGHTSPSPSFEVDCGKPASREARQDISGVQQYCVSLSDRGGFLYADDAMGRNGAGIKQSRSEEYLVLDTAR